MNRFSRLTSVSTALTLALASTLAGGCSSSAPGEKPEPDGGGTVLADGGDTVVVAGQSVSIARSTEARAAASSVPSAVVTAAVQANNAFAVDLYAQLRAKSASTNLLSSPLSASIALTMTYAGALGTTATQMATALHLGSAAATPPTASTIFAGQNALSQALAARAAAALQADSETAKGNDQPAPSSSNYQLQVVNSVWGESDYPWNASFLDILAQDYGTGVYLEDFATSYDPARVLINDVGQRRDGRQDPEPAPRGLARQRHAHGPRQRHPPEAPVGQPVRRVPHTRQRPSRRRPAAPSRRRS